MFAAWRFPITPANHAERCNRGVTFFFFNMGRILEAKFWSRANWLGYILEFSPAFFLKTRSTQNTQDNIVTSRMTLHFWVLGPFGNPDLKSSFSTYYYPWWGGWSIHWIGAIEWGFVGQHHFSGHEFSFEPLEGGVGYSIYPWSYQSFSHSPNWCTGSSPHGASLRLLEYLFMNRQVLRGFQKFKLVFGDMFRCFIGFPPWNSKYIGWYVPLFFFRIWGTSQPTSRTKRAMFIRAKTDSEETQNLGCCILRFYPGVLLMATRNPASSRLILGNPIFAGFHTC